ncbi:uncharacterized protein LOC134800641 [Cydia splendana]|uniref:uncharacterized protein LOC134800641 n=1 Tax=Cydia splendana TaxID=1100963 RepID=UPI00300CB5FC
MSVVYQALCTFIVCFIRMSLVISFSWPAFTTSLFKSEDTPLHRPMTEFEVAIYGSMLSIGALIFTPVMGLLLDVLGRKKCMMLAAVTHVFAWVIIVLTNRVEALLSAMFIAGGGVASFLVIPVYIAEVCQPSVRGTMTSCMMLAYGLGMLVSFLLAIRKTCKNVLRLNRAMLDKLSAFGVFEIDAAFSLRLLSALVPYTVMLLQFAFLTS